jgi:hypothetical protein
VNSKAQKQFQKASRRRSSSSLELPVQLFRVALHFPFFDGRFDSRIQPEIIFALQENWPVLFSRFLKIILFFLAKIKSFRNLEIFPLNFWAGRK